MPFEIRPGEVAVLTVPGGKPEDVVLRQTRSLLDHIYAPDVRDLVHSRKPAILRAEDEAHAASLSAIKQTRDGYDLYPRCLGPETTAAVRTEGAPFSWYGDYKPAVIEEFRARVGSLAPSQHSSGFGASCVDRRGAFQVYISKQNEADAAARAAGEWMARSGMQGEIDVIVLGAFVDASESMEDLGER